LSSGGEKGIDAGTSEVEVNANYLDKLRRSLNFTLIVTQALKTNTT